MRPIYSFVLVLFLTSHSFAEVYYGGTEPVLIDGFIDDDLRFATSSSVIIADGAMITGNVFVDSSSDFLMSGGTIEGSLGGDTDLRITGGEIQSGISASDWATYHISGGKFTGTIHAGDTSEIILHGESFNYPLGPIADFDGHLTGVLADDSPISNDFIISHTAFNRANITLVPEPCCGLLACFAVGCLALRSKHQ